MVLTISTAEREAGSMKRGVWGVFPGVCGALGLYFTPLLEDWRPSQAGLTPVWGVLGSLDPADGGVVALVIITNDSWSAYLWS